MIRMKRATLRPIALEALFVLLLAVALGHAGPYGTFDRLPLLERMAFWLLVLFIPWVITKALFLLAKRHAPEATSHTFLTIMLVPVIAILGSAVTTAINIEFGNIKDQPFFEVWPYSILTWLVFAFGIVLPMIFIGAALAREQRKQGVQSMMQFLHNKLPESIQGGQLLALKAEDHYLKVITDCGSALILMKFEDALSVLNGYPGIQTHRSWWVASSQLRGCDEISAASSNVKLQTGESVPVSRRRRQIVNDYIEDLRNSSA